MSQSSVSKKIKQLPPEAQKQANDFVDELYQRYVKCDESKKSESGKVSESSFFGKWKDRKEMEDSVEWVRKVRKSQWNKSDAVKN